MSALTCVVDWQDPIRWSPEKRARKADLYSLFWSATPESTIDLKGKKIVAFQPALPIMANGQVVPQPYPLALAAVVTKFNARTNLHLFDGADGGHLELIDLTRRGLAAAIARLRNDMFGWASGHHLDYYCRPDGLNIKDDAGAPAVFEESYLDAWDAGLLTLTSVLRSIKPDAILIGQNDRMQGGTWGAMSGPWIEQWWGFNGRTAVDHANDIADLTSIMRRYDAGRPLASVLEIREPEKFTPHELDLARAWCIGQGIHLALGRGDTARGAA